MLLRFGVSNWRSFSEYQQLSLMATKLKDTKSFFHKIKSNPNSVLPCVAVYGANAAGKSAVIHSLRSMVNFILYSHSRGNPNDPINRQNFLLDEMNLQPSKFDCDIYIDGVRYHYGFEFDDKEFRSEWLYAYPTTRRQVLFVRNIGENIYFGPEMPARSKARQVETLTRANSLFLSAAAQNNIETITNIYEWFSSNVFVSQTSNHLYQETIEISQNEKMREYVLNFIQASDQNVSDVAIEERELDKSVLDFSKSFNEFLKKSLPDIADSIDLGSEDREKMRKELLLVHKGRSGNVSFPSRVESTGTQRILALLGPILSALSKGTLIVVDELESSLHPSVSLELIKLFNNEAMNKNGAQLVFTTHDTNILFEKPMRRDQIWFVEKSEFGSSQIYSLAELSVRESDNVEKGYLQGRFGSVPFFKRLEKSRPISKNRQSN